MYALVESGNITKYFYKPQGFVLSGNQYSADIFTKWSKSEKEAIGLYEVIEDNTNWKNPEWYNNTAQSFTYDAGASTVTATYGTATAKPHADSLWTQQDKDDGLLGDRSIGDVKTEGLKTIKKREIDGQCAQILAPSDYMAIKAAEGITMDSGWKTWRANVRTKCNSMQTQIDNAANVDALAALFTYTEQEDKSITRPLGEFPVKE